MSINNPLRWGYEAYQKRKRDERAREAYVRKQGIAEGKAEAVLELLEGKRTLSEKLRIKILSEKEDAQLSRWLKLAVRSKTVEEFKESMEEDESGY